MNGIISMTRLKITNESARMVAAAGFILKQENMKARLTTVHAFSAMKACEHAYKPKPVCGSTRLKISNGGQTTAMLRHGNHSRANPTAVMPNVSTSAIEKMTPAIHFANMRLKRETGR